MSGVIKLHSFIYVTYEHAVHYGKYGWVMAIHPEGKAPIEVHFLGVNRIEYSVDGHDIGYFSDNCLELRERPTH